MQYPISYLKSAIISPLILSLSTFSVSSLYYQVVWLLDLFVRILLQVSSWELNRIFRAHRQGGEWSRQNKVEQGSPTTGQWPVAQGLCAQQPATHVTQYPSPSPHSWASKPQRLGTTEVECLFHFPEVRNYSFSWYN